MILDLKMKTYAEQNSNVDSDSIRKDSEVDDDDEKDESVQSDPQHEIDAYKDIEITELIYQQRFVELREAYWNVL